MRIALIGAGGLAKEYLEVAQLSGHEIVATFSSSGSLAGIPNLGYLDDISANKDKFDAVAIAIGVNNSERIQVRRTILNFLNDRNIKQANLISPYSRVHSSVILGEGVYIHHNVIISCDAQIGNGVIINTSAQIGHDCRIGDNVSVGPNVFIGGGTVIGDDILLGVASVIKDGIEIGSNCVVGMGSVVVKSMKENQLMMPQITKAISISFN
jgi:sugar O-acyltransferase (sialic acid O-acetyltransferase NeuD family)